MQGSKEWFASTMLRPLAHWFAMLTGFFIGFPSIFTYENKSIALWHLALFPLAPYELGAKEL